MPYFLTQEIGLTCSLSIKIYNSIVQRTSWYVTWFQKRKIFFKRGQEVLQRMLKKMHLKNRLGWAAHAGRETAIKVDKTQEGLKLLGKILYEVTF